MCGIRLFANLRVAPRHKQGSSPQYFCCLDLNELTRSEHVGEISMANARRWVDILVVQGTRHRLRMDKAWHPPAVATIAAWSFAE